MNTLIMSPDLHVNKHTRTLTLRLVAQWIAVDCRPVTGL